VKNKVAPPFKQAEFDIMFSLGISKSGDLLDLGTEMGLLRKSGANYSFGETRLGQGREKAKDFLNANPEVALALERQIRGIDVAPVEPTGASAEEEAVVVVPELEEVPVGTP
jgi:recombination protein RecA